MQLIRIVSLLTKVIASYAISIQYITLTTTVYQNLTQTDYTTLDSSTDLTTHLFPKVTPPRKPKFPKTYSFKFDNEGLLQLGQGPTPNFFNNSLTSHSHSTIVNNENYTSQWDFDENYTSQWDLDHCENDTFSIVTSTKSLDYYLDQSLTESNSIVEPTTIFPIETHMIHKDKWGSSQTDSFLSDGIVTEAPSSSEKMYEYISVDTDETEYEIDSETDSTTIESVATATATESSHTVSTTTYSASTELTETDSTQKNSTTTKSTTTKSSETNTTENTSANPTINPPEPSTSKSQSTNSNFIPSNLQTPKSTKSKPSPSVSSLVTNPSTYPSSTTLPLPHSISTISKSFSLVVHNNILNGSNSHIIDSFLLFVLFVLSL